jgi:glucokinase
MTPRPRFAIPAGKSKVGQLDVGVDLGGTNIKLGLVDVAGKVLARELLPTRAKKGPKQALERIAEASVKLAGGRRLRSIGIGLPGLVDHIHGVVRVPPNLPKWNGAPVKHILERLTGVPVFVANDVNAVTLGEWKYGAGRDCSDLLCITLGTGLGGGIVAGGRLLLGANQAAGEIGHTTIDIRGLACKCGNRGCVERYVGAAYIVDRAKRRVRAQLRRIKDHRNQLPMFDGVRMDGPSLVYQYAGDDVDAITTKHIGQAARAGDKLALGLVEEVGSALGAGLANAVQLIDPERIVIGGGVSGLGQPLLRATRRSLFKLVPFFAGRKLAVVLSKLGRDAGVVGASRLADCRFD